VELGQKREAFAKQGLNVAAVSYDSTEVLKVFAQRKGITYSLLSDSESKMIRAFGILNEQMPQDTTAYGVPYPGTYVVDAQGVVREKYFETDVKERFSAGNILLRAAPGASGEAWQEVETRHLKLRYGASDMVVWGGSRVTLLLEVTLAPGMHVYAPGVEGGYIPVKWELTGGAKASEPQWPASKVLRLEAIKETVPVYEGSLTVRRDVTFAQQKVLQAQGAKVEGTFRYQACDAKECYPPVSVPLKWSFKVEALDAVRVPEGLRRQ
jgi:hypothetical protein